MALLVLAGSLSPFTFDFQAAGEAGLTGYAGIGWPRSGVDDLLTNVLIYLPVGACFFLWIRRRAGLVGSVVLAIAAGGLLSLSAEMLQTALPVRTASWIDVIANLAGCFMGALAAPPLSWVARNVIGRLRSNLADSPLATLATGAVFAVLLAGLMPFDFVLGTDALHASLARSRWSMLPPEVTRTDVDAMTSTLALAGLFAGMGFLTGLTQRQTERRRWSAFEAAVGKSLLLAVLIETLQVFIGSRSFELLDICLNLSAATCGAYLARVTIDASNQSGRNHHLAILASPMLLVPVIVAQIALRAAPAIIHPGTDANVGSHAPLSWMPFSAYYGHPLNLALADMAATCIAFALLAGTVAVLASRWTPATRWAAGIVVSVACAGLIEILATLTAHQPADPTQPLLALIGAYLAWITYRRLMPDTFPIPIQAADHRPSCNP